MGDDRHRLFRTLVVMGAMLGGGCNAFDEAPSGPDQDFPPGPFGGFPAGMSGVAGNFGAMPLPPVAGAVPLPPVMPEPPMLADNDGGLDDDAGAVACDPVACNCGAGLPECASCEVIFCAIT